MEDKKWDPETEFAGEPDESLIELLTKVAIMKDDIALMKDRIKKYFSTVTKEQLKDDMDKAGVSHYKNVKMKILYNFPSINTVGRLYEAFTKRNTGCV